MTYGLREKMPELPQTPLLKNAIEILLEEGPKELAKRSLSYVEWRVSEKVLSQNGRLKAIESVYFRLWRQGLVSGDHLYTQGYYEEMVSEESAKRAEEFAESLNRYFDPTSVIDFGTGCGRFLAPFEDSCSILGIDFNRHALQVASAQISARSLEQVDLTKYYEADQEYDLALCIEVLEHLPEEASETVVRSIADSAQVAVVSPAPPGQGGTHHVNEQNFEYWIELFEGAGMEFDEQMTDQLRSDAPERLLRENILVFHH